MSAPTVACVMLANGRPEMVARAVKSFRAQTYGRTSLVMFDSGADQFDSLHVHVDAREFAGCSIGKMRNAANQLCTGADIILHWDSDDWSHPNRIAEQVALLQSSGAECVGYHEMLFWDQTVHPDEKPDGAILGYSEDEAWLYRASIPNYAIGTSMCYWRETWERHPFRDASEGCDDLEWFNKGVKISSVSAFQGDFGLHGALNEPRMIASIHGGNTCSKIDAGKREWSRSPEWDAYCREAMRI